MTKFPGSRAHFVAVETVHVSKSTSGTDYWPMILTMTVLAYLWTGSYFQLAVLAGHFMFFFNFHLQTFSDLISCSIFSSNLLNNNSRRVYLKN